MKAILILLLLFSMNLANAETILLKTYTFKHPIYNFNDDGYTYAGWFEIPNVILIYDINNLSEAGYNDILLHELVHYNCWKLYKDVDADHNRCFTGKGIFLID